MADQRLRLTSRGAWIGIVGNMVLAVMKFIVGMISNSRALVADAARSASDAAGACSGLIGLRTAHIRPDRDHAFRHGKAESIAAIVVSLLILYVALEIIVNSVQTVVSGVDQAPKEIAFMAIIISIIVKESLVQYKIRLGKRLNSQGMIAHAREHRSSIYSSVVALCGIGGSMLGSYMGMPRLLFYLDPLAGIVVALMLLKMGYNLIRESIFHTMDHVIYDEDTHHIYDTIGKVKGVQAIDSLKAREHGHYLIVDVKISVNPKITVLEGHEIGRHVKALLKSRFSNVLDVYVHIYPYDPSYPYNAGYGQSDGDRPTLLH